MSDKRLSECVKVILLFLILWVHTLGLCTQIFCTVIRCRKLFFCTHNDFCGCKCVIVCVTYGVLRVIFVISLMCSFAFVFVVFILISPNKVCEFSLSFCTVMFYVAPCKIVLQKVGAKTQRNQLLKHWTYQHIV